MNKTKNTSTYLLIIVLPFVLGAVWEFLPTWVAWPFTLISVMLWFGSCFMIANKE